MTTENQIATKNLSLVPTTMEEALRFADVISRSALVPNDYRGKPENCFVAMQMGMEVGLAPLQAIQNIANINGRPSLWGDAVLALIKTDPKFEWITEEFDDKTFSAICTIKRKGEPEVRRTFSKEDAEIAGIWGKNVHRTYPKRMLQMRARGFACRDAAPHILKGISIAEEAMDIEEKYMGSVQTVEASGESKKAEAKQLPDYPDSDLDKNASKWTSIIESGRKTPEQIIATVSSKYALTDDQKQRIMNLASVPVDAEFEENDEEFYKEAGAEQ